GCFKKQNNSRLGHGGNGAWVENARLAPSMCRSTLGLELGWFPSQRMEWFSKPCNPTSPPWKLPAILVQRNCRGGRHFETVWQPEHRYLNHVVEDGENFVFEPKTL